MLVLAETAAVVAYMTRQIASEDRLRLISTADRMASFLGNVRKENPSALAPSLSRLSGLEVFGGPDGRTAYATDQIEYDGVAFAVTIIAAEIDGLWAFTTIEVTRALNRKRLDTAVAPGPLPKWKPTDGEQAAHTAAPRWEGERRGRRLLQPHRCQEQHGHESRCVA